MYVNPEDRQYSAETLEAELQRRKDKIPGAIDPAIAEIMDGVTTAAIGESFDVPAVVKGADGEQQTYASITRIQDDVYTVFTCYVDLRNHKRGPCIMGVERGMTPGMGFAALGGNSMAPATGFTEMRHEPVFRVTSQGINRYYGADGNS